MVDTVGAQPIADGVGLPGSATAQIWDARRGRLAAHFRHWPAVLPRRLAEHALQPGQGALPGLRTDAIGCHPPRHLCQGGPTTLDGAATASVVAGPHRSVVASLCRMSSSSFAAFETKRLALKFCYHCSTKKTDIR
jgi:hypothetical protein